MKAIYDSKISSFILALLAIAFLVFTIFISGCYYSGYKKTKFSLDYESEVRQEINVYDTSINSVKTYPSNFSSAMRVIARCFTEDLKSVDDAQSFIIAIDEVSTSEFDEVVNYLIRKKAYIAPRFRKTFNTYVGELRTIERGVVKHHQN